MNSEENTPIQADDIQNNEERVDEEQIDALNEEEKQQRILLLQPIVEAAVMASADPLTLDKLQTLFEEHEKPSKSLLREILESISNACADRGFELREVASGWRFQVREDYAAWVNRLWEEKPQKYSRALLETLALIAYRQPITRGDIEEVRGVAVSSHIIKTLMERDWVKVVGHRDVPGRPALYATTRDFLDYFNLKSLEELPMLGELQDIDNLNAPLALGEVPVESDHQTAEATPGEDDSSNNASPSDQGDTLVTH